MNSPHYRKGVTVGGNEFLKKDKMEDDDIWCPPNNYAYHINIRHPVVAVFLKQYRAEEEVGNFPLSDFQRHEFEHRFLNWVAHNHLQIEAGKLLDVSVVDDKVVIDHEARNNRIRQIIAETGEYRPKPAFELPDFVKAEIAEMKAARKAEKAEKAAGKKPAEKTADRDV